MDVSENQIPVLIIEHPGIYSDFIESFFQQCEGEEGEIIISDRGKNLKLSKSALIVLDYFSLNFNNRQIQTKLYQQLKNAGAELSIQKDEFTHQGIDLIENVFSISRFDHIEYNLELDWADIFKLYQVRVEADYDSIQEKLVSFLRICAELLDLKLVAFVNLKAYVSEDDLLEIYRMAGYLKVNLLLIESIETYSHPMEKYFIIDKDQCIIIK